MTWNGVTKTIYQNNPELNTTKVAGPKNHVKTYSRVKNKQENFLSIKEQEFEESGGED